MKNSRFDVLKSQKHSLSSSLDENSKKIQKLRIKIKDSKLNKTMPSSVRIDMKSVRVLVERTKFNVMLNLDGKFRHKNSPKSSSISHMDLKKTPLKKLLNKAEPLASSTPQQQQNSPQKKTISKTKTTTTATHHQPTIDGIFKIRKCCIKLPKDKLLLELQQKQMPYPVKLIVHKARGRPRKDQIEGNSLIIVESPPSGQKRKSTEKPSSSSPPKRKIKKGNEFFIKIGALTRIPSPKRRLASSSSSPEEKPPQNSKQRRHTAKKLNKKALASSRLAPLRQKFGSRFFKSFVKIKRFGPNWEQQSSFNPPNTDKPPKKKNAKNLSVSFLETVEIFGESSDDEDWFDMDAKNSSRPTKPLDNLFDSLKASTPCIRTSSSSSNSSNSSSSGILKSSILDRKEKKSFSPLKETESPRKQQLKLANESFVRRSLETQIADEEERDIAEDLTETESAEKSSAVPESGIVNDIEHNSTDLPSKSDDDAPSELITPPPLISDDKDNEVEEEKEEQLNSSNNSEVEKSSRHTHESNEDEEETAIQTNQQENEDSFRSANASITEDEPAETGESLDETQNLPAAESDEPEQNVQESKAEEEPPSEQQAKPEGEQEDEQEDEREDEQEDEHKDEHEDEHEEDQDEDKTNEDEISTEVCPDDDGNDDDDDDEEPFVDPSKLVASVLLNDPAEDERNEAEAVLNDVCQMAAAESAVLLSPVSHLAYSSPHSALDDDDDDFNSVLTHPETEKTLQSTAASDLVPNSQEIAVEAAVASQATMVAPPDVDVTEDTFASVVAEVERFTKDVNSEIYSADVGITGADVMMDNVQARHSLDDIFDDDVDGQSHMFLQFPDDIMSSLRISSGSIDIGHDKSLPIQVIETEVMAIPNEPDLIFDKPLGTTLPSLMNGPQLNSVNDTLPAHLGATSTTDSNKKLFGRLFQSVKSYVMSPGGDKNSSLQD